jgi:sulfatase maturation enzyme AslB (radical SAM superfamily)
MDPKIKYKLFRQNKHFCAAPWNLLFVDMNGQINSCTRGGFFGSPSIHALPKILSNEKYKKLRTDIINDKLTDNCKRCINFENHSTAGEFKSLRNHYNDLVVDSETDYTDPSAFKLMALDLHWSSICNLKCVTCWAKQSSSIAREQNKPVNHTPPEVADRIIEYILSNQSYLKEIYLSGGEPTLIKYNLKLLKHIEKRPEILIRVNTNMQWKQSNPIIKEILKFPNVLFTCSIDGMGEEFNYIRRGGDWKVTLANIKFLQSQTNVKIRANTVFFVLTAQTIPQIIDYFMEEVGSMDHTINQCQMGQDDLRARNLPPDIKNKVRKRLAETFDKYKNKLNIAGNIKNCLLELDNEATSDRYKEYFDHIDKLQGSNWRKLFPELT